MRMTPSNYKAAVHNIYELISHGSCVSLTGSWNQCLASWRTPDSAASGTPTEIIFGWVSDKV